MSATARCVICNHEVSSTEGLSECPKCGTRSLPCDPSLDVSIAINWHELEVLCNWAMFWANQHEATSAPHTSMQQTIFSIVQRIHAQHPQIRRPLTLAGELRELKDKGVEFKTNIPYEEGFDPTA